VPPCGSVSPCWSTSRMSRWSSVSCSPPPRTPSYASGPLEPCDGNHDDGHELATCPDLDEDDEQEPTQTDEQEPIHASHPRGARIRIGRRRVVGVVVACMVVTLSTSAMHLSTSASASAATNATDAVVAADAAGAAYPSTPMTSASPDATDMTMPPLPPPPPSPSPLPSPLAFAAARAALRGRDFCIPVPRLCAAQRVQLPGHHVHAELQRPWNCPLLCVRPPCTPKLEHTPF